MNVTLSISEDTIRDARAYAEKHGTSVNQIIREHLDNLSRRAERRERAQTAMAFFENFMPTVPAGTRITREELEER